MFSITFQYFQDDHFQLVFSRVHFEHLSVPSSSSGAMRLAANFNTAVIRFVDSPTASLTTFMGSELIWLSPPGRTQT